MAVAAQFEVSPDQAAALMSGYACLGMTLTSNGDGITYVTSDDPTAARYMFAAGEEAVTFTKFQD